MRSKLGEIQLTDLIQMFCLERKTIQAIAPIGTLFSNVKAIQVIVLVSLGCWFPDVVQAQLSASIFDDDQKAAAI
jgi:hypothetical protein